MNGDGLADDGIFGAVLLARPNLTIIEFYVEASDGAANSRTWPAPARQTNDVTSGNFAQTCNALYQVDDTAETPGQPYYRFILTAAEALELDQIGRNLPSGVGAAQSDAAVNGTFHSADGIARELRYLCSLRNRGNGSRTARPNNIRLDIPNDHRWNGVRALVLNTVTVQAQVAGAVLAQKSGVPMANCRPVQVRINGANAGGGAPSLGSYAHNEEFASEMAQRHWPDDPGGNLYRANRNIAPSEFDYRGEDRNSYTNTYYKQSNQSADDWTDLIAMLRAMETASNGEYLEAIAQVIDIEQWLRFFAFETLVDNNETSLSNGFNDDYAMYAGANDRRFRLLTYDQDSILGNQGSSTTASLFRMTGQPVIARFINHPEILPRYFAHLKELCDTTFSATQINPALDRIAGQFQQISAVQSAFGSMKAYAAARVSYVLARIPTNLTVTSTLPLVNGYLQSTDPTTTLSGQAPIIATRSVLVNGDPATWNGQNGTWTHASVALRPGINRVLVQSLGVGGVEVARAFFDVWYDDGTIANVPAIITTPTTLTAAGGPYLVNGNGGVNSALTIEAGTTVYFASGARLSVVGGLSVEGTDTARVRFTRPPGGSGTWGGIFIEDTSSPVVLENVDFDYADNAAGTITVGNSTLFVDSCTWSNTTRTLFDLSNASLDLRRSILPALTAGSHVRGHGIAPGGFVVIDGNVFGAAASTNAAIDFTGAARPGPVVQVLNNTFLGSGDDAIQLRGADAHVEGNVFVHVRKDNNVTGNSANAIAAGAGTFAGTNYAPHVVAVRNLFFDVDHVALARDRAALTLENNTAVGVHVAAVNFSEPELLSLPARAAYLDGNIFWNTEGVAGTNFQNRFPTNGAVALTAHRGIYSATDGLTNGTANLTNDPRLVSTDTSALAAENLRTAFALRPGSPAGGTGPNGLDRGALVPAGASISGEPATPTALTTATLTVRGPGISNYIHRVDGGAWSSERPVTQAINLSSLAAGSHAVEALGRDSAGVLQSASTPTISRIWTVDPATPRVRLNEVLARNATTRVINGETPDLVELFNDSDNTVSLTDWILTDATFANAYIFPAGVVIEPHDHLLLYADSEPGPGLHLGFGLKQSGDGLQLFDSSLAPVDSVNFGPQVADFSIGRRADGSWGLMRPTFPGPNVVQPTGDAHRLQINEWLTDGAGTFPDDYVELYNPDSQPVALGGLFLTDAVPGFLARHEIAPLSYIAAGGFISFRADGNAEAGPDHLNFSLSPLLGQIGLFDEALGLIDCIFYGPQFTGIAEGRRPNGATTIAFLSTPTPGAGNPGAAGMATVSNFVVNLVPMTNVWRFHHYGQDLGAAWRETFFNDSSWSNGPALLAAESPGVYIEPIRTPLWLTPPGSNSQVITYYFRTHFNVPSNLSSFTLIASNYLDDGAVYWLNGTEVGRLRITGNPVTYGALAGNQPSEGLIETLTLSGTSLVVGDNVLAVEVHQGNSTSTDAVFGMALAAVKSTTNAPGTSVVLNEVFASNSSITNADGTRTDLIELYNPGATAADLSGMSLTDDIDAPRQWVIPAGVTIPAGEMLVVRCDPDSPASTNAGSVLNTGFALDAAGDNLYLFDAATTPTLLDAVVFGVQAADFSIGRVPDGLGQWALCLPALGFPNVIATLGNPNNLRINEWMADPKSGEDDWFELFNPGVLPVALHGLFLTDRINTPKKHAIAPLSFIGSFTNGYVQFIADDNEENGPNHVAFALAAGGEAIGLFPTSGPAIDTVSFGSQQKNVSEGRLPDGGTNIVRFAKTASPGEGNYLPLTTVVIHEALSHSDPPLEDAIELHNLADVPVSIGGWYLSDSGNDLRKFRIPDGTTLLPGGFKVFYETEFNPLNFAGAFSLSSAQGDQIYLSTADTNANLTGYRDIVKFGAQLNGVSFGRYETSDDVDFVALTARTFGMDTPSTVNEFRGGSGLSNAPIRVGPVVIHEIMYHPPDIGTNDNVLDEFIELRNLGGAAVSLFHSNFPANTWRLRDAVKFDFPPGITLPAGGYLLVVSFDPTNTAQATDFRTRYAVPGGVPLFGPYGGKLDNAEDSVELLQPDEPQMPPSPDAGFVPYVLADRVNYKDNAPWPTAADGSTNGVGVSLQRRIASAYGNDPVNWLAGFPTAGAATGPAVIAPPNILTPPASQTVTAGTNATFSVSVTGGAPLRFAWWFNGCEIAGATNATLTLANVSTNSAGRYTVLISNPAGATSSPPATLNIQSPPVIVLQPQSRVVIAGATTNFTVLVNGTPPLRYQWRFNGNNLTGATNAGIIITNVQAPTEGGYSVVITNLYGSTTSTVATLTISAPPVITSQPTNLVVFVGDAAAFAVTATGSAPLRYQWRRNGNNLANATNNSLTLSNAQNANAGNYTVVITNIIGSTTSSVATLSVVPQPSVTIAATDASAAEAGLDPGVFTVTRSFATNTPLTISFNVGGSASPGSDYTALTSPVTIPANQSSATLTVTPVNDPTAESPETVIVTLVKGTGYTLGSPENAQLTLLDNDNLVPSVVITNPSNGTLYPISPTNILLVAIASDSDGTVARVEYFNFGTNKVGEASAPPYAVTWTNAPAGSNAVTAVATDNLGAQGVSAPVAIIVNALPTVSITSPSSGAAFLAPANVTINANAADADGSVTQVQFFVNSTNLVGTDTSSPYSIEWTNVPIGSYSLTARAQDNRGASRNSTAVNVTVVNQLANLTDIFANRVTLGGFTNRVTGSTTGTSKESGEPNHGSDQGGRSVWIAWTAPAAGTAVADTLGSSFDTTLGVYRGTAVNALTSVAQNNNIGDGITQSRVTFSVTAGVTYQIAVDGNRFNGFTPTGLVTLSFGMPVQNNPPSITQQPASQTVAAGTSASFSVGATGPAPLTYHWHFNGGPISGANAATLTLTNVTIAQQGAYSVIVSNAFGTATSGNATLTVDDGLVTTRPVNLVPIHQSWRYHESGADLGTAWRAPGYNDSTWPEGAALFGFEPDNNYFEPMTTPLTPPQVGGPVTVYLRTRFQFTNTPGVVSLLASNFLDDGAIVYLNGTEVFRSALMPAGPVTYITFTTVSLGVEGLTNINTFPASGLVLGENVLAVELHQSSSNSSDVVFGLSLDAVVTVTNQPVLVDARMLAGGSFEVTLEGIAGRRYAVERSTDLFTWSPWTTFTNITGRTVITDVSAPGQSPRFYRGRLVP